MVSLRFESCGYCVSHPLSWGGRCSGLEHVHIGLEFSRGFYPTCCYAPFLVHLFLIIIIFTGLQFREKYLCLASHLRVDPKRSSPGDLTTSLAFPHPHPVISTCNQFPLHLEPHASFPQMSHGEALSILDLTWHGI